MERETNEERKGRKEERRKDMKMTGSKERKEEREQRRKQ